MRSVGPGSASSRSRRSLRDSPSLVQGYSSRNRRRAAERNGSACRSLRQSRSRPSGSEARKALQARSGERVLRLADRAAGLDERRQFVRRELAQSLERGSARKRSDAHEADGLRGRNAAPNPGQELNQVQLIEQVVLEPEDHLVVRLVPIDGGSPRSERVLVFVLEIRVGSDEKTLADGDELLVGQPAGNRPLIQHDRPTATAGPESRPPG